FAFGVTALGTFLVTLLVPAADHGLWADAPLVGLAQHLAAPQWLRDVFAVAVAASAIVVLFQAADAALREAERMFHRASLGGVLPRGLVSLHTRFGTPAGVADLAAAVMIAVTFASGGRVTWLARAYAIEVAAMLALAATALVRLRRKGIATPFRAPLNLQFRGRVLPLGLIGTRFIVIIT